MTGNKVYNNWHCGIEARDEATLTAEENEVKANNFGVLVGRQATAQLTGNTVHGNFVTGIDVSKRNKDKEDDEAVTTIANNSVKYNLESGVKLWFDAEAKLDGNNIYANLQEIKLTPRSRRHVGYGQVEEGGEEGEEGAPKGLYGNNKVVELHEILHPSTLHDDVGEPAAEGGEPAPA